MCRGTGHSLGMGGYTIRRRTCLLKCQNPAERIDLPRLLSAVFALFPLSRDSISICTVICLLPSMPWTRTSHRGARASCARASRNTRGSYNGAMFALFPLSRDSISICTIICFLPSMPRTRMSRRGACV